MVDKFGAINLPGPLRSDPNLQSPATPNPADQDKGFKDLLMQSIHEVNRLQAEADQARINLATGQSDNVAEVFTAIKKAELAFQTLMQIRNKLMDAYDEIKQMRV